MRRYGLYILDLDGTLFRGNEPLPNAVATVTALKHQGAQVRFLTNNSSLTREAYFQKLSGMGFPVEPAEIYSSAIGAASYCSVFGLRNLYVIGEKGLVQTLREGNLTVVNARDDGAVQPECEIDPSAVLVGIHKAFNYQLMTGAMQQILGGARFIATNTDATYPLEQQRLIPGAGAIVASLEKCCGQEAFVIGKPNPFLIELVMRDAGIFPQETLVVGDRYETDIESGKRAGADTHLVLTGVTKAALPGQSASADIAELI